MKNNKLLVLADQMVFSGSSFLSTFLLARLLSITEFGIYSGIMLVIYLMISMSNALIIQPLQIIYPKIKNRRHYLNFIFWTQISSSAICVLIVYGFSHLNLDFIKSFELYLPEVLLLISSFLIHDFFRKTFLAIDCVSQALWIDCLMGLLQISLLVNASFSGTLTLSEAIYFSGIAYLMGSALGVFYMRPGFFLSPEFKQFLIEHIRQGKWLLFTAIVQWWSGNLFVVASGIFIGAIALGAFRLVQSMFGILNILLQSFENYVLPQAVRLFQSSVSESKKYLQAISIKSSVLFGIVLLVLFIFSSPIIQLAGGEKYLPYAYLIRGMAVLYFIIFVGYPIRMAVRMMVMNHIFFMGYAVSFVFSLLSFHFLLREWQLWGAIIGLIVNQLILISFWQYFLVSKQFILWR